VIKRVLFLLILGIALLGTQVQAQTFRAYNQLNQPVIAICVNEPITFKDNTSRSADPLFAEFYYINGAQISLPYTFKSPGEYEVRQLANGFESTTLKFTVKAAAPPSPPVLQKITVQGTSLLYQLQTSAENDLVLERADSPAGPFTEVQKIAASKAGQNSGTVTLPSVGGCYRVRVTNICSGREDIISNVVCAQTFNVTAGDRQNNLSWSPNLSPGNVLNFQILRGGQPLQTLPGSQFSYIDAQVACGRQYSYQLVALLTGGAQSVSQVVPVETKGNTPPAAPFLIASFNGQNQVMLQTVVPTHETFKEQSIYRSQGGAFNLITGKHPRNALDTSLGTLSSPLCYQVSYTDSCNLASARSASSCPVILTAASQTGGGVLLSWNTYQGFPGGSGSQVLQLLDEQGTVYWSVPVSGQTFLDEKPQERFQRLTYRLLSSAANASYESFSNTASVDQGFQFFFPNAFTPNNDGLNDVFKAVGAPFASKYTLQVLNRWGQIIYEGKDPKAGWDGTHGGKPAPPETYLYRLEAIDVNGQRVTQKGTVTLIR
jgi:gliding motility-associated-like protein